MDAPQIRYARADGGVSLAYSTIGDRSRRGLLIVPWGVTHQALSWEIAPVRAWLERLARSFFVVRYDLRGMGLSQGAGVEGSIEQHAADIAAVARAAGLEGYALYTNAAGTPHAVRHVVEHPDDVSHFILAGPQLSSDRVTETNPIGVITAGNWPFVREAMGRAIGAESVPDVAEQWVHLFAQSIEGEQWQRHTNAVRAWPTRDDLPGIRTETLVIGVTDVRYSLIDDAREAAALVPGAALAVLRGPWPDQRAPEEFARAIEAFVSEGEADEANLPGGFQTILFTDLEASTPLTQRLGDEGAQELLRSHNATVRGALDAHGGREVKHTGDGIMASFPSAVAAVTAALQIQRELAGGEVRVRVGLNAGEPIAEDDDLFGLSVIKAARVADRAEPGQVLVSRVVRELCEGKTFQFTSLGDVSLKGFDEAVELFEVAG